MTWLILFVLLDGIVRPANACDLGLDNGVVIIDESGGTIPTGTQRVCENGSDSQRVLGNLRCRMAGTAVNTTVESWPADVRFSSRTGTQIADELKRGLAISGARVIANTEQDPKHMEVSALRTLRGMQAKVGVLLSTVIVKAPDAAAPGEMKITMRMQARMLDNWGRHVGGHEQSATLTIKDAACQAQLNQYFASRSSRAVPDCIHNNVIESDEEMWDTSMPRNSKGHRSPALALGRVLKEKLSAKCPKDGAPVAPLNNAGEIAR